MKKFEITKEQIIEMASWGNSRDNEKVKEWFPEAFEKKLEAGKWYKHISTKNTIVFKEEREEGYGFYNGIYSNDWAIFDADNWTKATPQEVETALINEAKKRGFKENENASCYWEKEDITHSNMNGDLYYDSSLNVLFIGSYAIFDDGKWATITETITIQEAEKLLNKKIV